MTNIVFQNDHDEGLCFRNEVSGQITQIAQEWGDHSFAPQCAWQSEALWVSWGGELEIF